MDLIIDYNFYPYHAEYFYVLHSSPIFILLTSRIQDLIKLEVEISVYLDQLSNEHYHCGHTTTSI